MSQNNWDIGISQLSFSYNSSIHATTKLSPFYVMFGRECRIPIDIIYPSKLELTKTKIIAPHTISIKQIKQNIEMDQNSNINEIDILPDITINEIEAKFPLEVQVYVNEQRVKLKKSYETLERNMSKNKEIYDRKIRKKSYKVGDWVLCNHPHIKKGLSRGLAPRYHGPYIIIGKYENGCDYLIRPHNQPRAKVKQIHQNSLKLYFRRGHPVDSAKIDHTSDIDIAVPSKRLYHKNPANPRWQKNPSDNANDHGYDAEASSNESDSSHHSESSSKDTSSSEPNPEPRRRGKQ